MVPWGAATVVFVAACIVASVVITTWLWPACAPLAAAAPVRAGGLAGVGVTPLAVLAGEGYSDSYVSASHLLS